MRKSKTKLSRFAQMPAALCAGIAALCLTTGPAHLYANAENDALLDLLVKKGVVTAKEADALAATAAQEAKSGPPDYSIDNKFLTIDKYVKSVKLYGDMRLREDYRRGEAGSATDASDRTRTRYRLRLNLDAQLNDDWFLGIRLETSNDGRGTNVNFGENPAFNKASATTSTVAGSKVVTKVDYGSTVFVGQLYLRYNPVDWLTVEGGRLPNPLVTTPMVWDPDVNPEGFAEQLKFTVGGSKSAPVANYSKDGKSVAAAPAPSSGFSVDLFANLAQFLYDEGDPQNAFGSVPDHADSWLLVEQIGAKLNFSKAIYFQFAPTYMTYTARGNDLTADFSGDAGLNQTGIDDLQILDIPVELGFQAFGLPITVFGDYAINFSAPGRADRAGHASLGDENLAWMAGFGVGKLKSQGDFAGKVYYQHSEEFALDPNLIDNDIFDARLNMQGVIARIDYALTDFLSMGVLYNFGNRLDKNIGTGGAGGGLATDPLKDYNLVMFDVNVKF
jgi:hypothetical protein